MKYIAYAALTGAALTAFAAVTGEWSRKTVGDSWTRLEEYVYVQGNYVVACEPGRECEIGMGIFAFGKPRGEIRKFRGEREIMVIGVGALHARAADGRGPVMTAFILKDATLIKTPPILW